MRDYEQELFDAVTKLHDNLQYCMVSYFIEGSAHLAYTFVNSVDIFTSHMFYDGYYGIEFGIDDLTIFITDESFAVWDNTGEEYPKQLFSHVSDSNLEIIDKHSYFQCSIIENLQGIRWELFPMMKKIRSTFFEEWYTKSLLEDGFKFI